jgi:two-component system sensor histidine kinase KdpD
VVNHLLEITRIESGIIRPQPEWCLLSETASSLRQSFRQMFPKRGLVVGALPEPMVLCDAVLLEKSLWNLLHNAAVYTPEEKPVELDFSLAEGTLTIRVRDHGPGIPEEERSRIFEKFYRGSPSRAGGTGLGLAISQGFIRSMNGTIEVEQAPGGGTLFIIRLPVEWRRADSLPGS